MTASGALAAAAGDDDDDDDYIGPAPPKSLRMTQREYVARKAGRNDCTRLFDPPLTRLLSPLPTQLRQGAAAR